MHDDSDEEMLSNKRPENSMTMKATPPPPPPPRQSRLYREEEKLVDPLIQQLNAIKDDDPFLSMTSTRKERRVTRRAAAE